MAERLIYQVTLGEEFNHRMLRDDDGIVRSDRADGVTVLLDDHSIIRQIESFSFVIGDHATPETSSDIKGSLAVERAHSM